ncbi:hypothetical protein SLEP1_g29546 [Rubroshorea leprosula]|uniref:Uncharacterized protein n=1 Tax=Rubroshorea leprosula TaxID=152421 RepID=A0AAV5K3R8_9ROSI|nr:hypothetical protein SLEP1_g29546 [Rubroshorea leprosula]
MCRREENSLIQVEKMILMVGEETRNVPAVGDERGSLRAPRSVYKEEKGSEPRLRV